MPKKVLVDFSRFYECINKCYWDFFDNRGKSRIRLLYGGGGSGKSYFAFQEMIYRVITEPGNNYLVIRKVGNTHRSSTYALTQQIISEFKMWDIIKQNKSDMTFKCTLNDNMIIFKGCDDREKLKSVTAENGIITTILCEESTELSYDDVNQLNIRLRGKNKTKVPFNLIMLFNPISVKHWIYLEFFKKRSFQKKFKVDISKTTYLDNKHLDDDYRSVLEGYKDIDEQFYNVYCLGEFGVFGNTIFNNYSFQPIKYEREDFDCVFRGIDFGFNHPNVIELTGLKDGVLYSFDELCCFEKTNMEFIELNEEFEILEKNKRVICDSADPDKIKEWQSKGYQAIGAKKGKGSVLRGIDFIKSHKWIIDPEKCPRLAQEVEIFSWKKTKDGQNLDEPIEIMDDAIKSIIYALEELSGMKPAPGVLSGSKTDHKKELIDKKREVRRMQREVLKEQAKKKRKNKK